jgi:hypothetical protein
MIAGGVTSEFPTISDMSKSKKPSSGEHKTPRQNVGLPADWHAILRRIAASRKTTVVYAMIDLIAEEAGRVDIHDLPEFPWEKDEAK